MLFWQSWKRRKISKRVQVKGNGREWRIGPENSGKKFVQNQIKCEDGTRERGSWRLDYSIQSSWLQNVIDDVQDIWYNIQRNVWEKPITFEVFRSEWLSVEIWAMWKTKKTTNNNFKKPDHQLSEILFVCFAKNLQFNNNNKATERWFDSVRS